jgi:hypothetical protein
MARDSLGVLHSSAGLMPLDQNMDKAAAAAHDDTPDELQEDQQHTESDNVEADTNDINFEGHDDGRQTPQSTSTITTASDHANSPMARRQGMLRQHGHSSSIPDSILSGLRIKKVKVDDDETDEMVDKFTSLPLHERETEHEKLEMEAALRYRHNRRVLLARLEDTMPSGRLYMVRTFRCFQKHVHTGKCGSL